MFDYQQVETSDHARLKVEYAMNNYFEVGVLCYHGDGCDVIPYSMRAVILANYFLYQTSSDLPAEK